MSAPESLISVPPTLELRRAIACLVVEVPGEVWDDINAKAEAVMSVLEGQLGRHDVAGPTCKSHCLPASGGSYCCALQEGHDGPHASLWNRPSPEHPVLWDGETVRWT